MLSIIPETGGLAIEPKKLCDEGSQMDKTLTDTPASNYSAQDGLLSAADEATFLLTLTNVARTSWSWQNAKARMNVHYRNRGRCRFSARLANNHLLKNPSGRAAKSPHRTPHIEAPCSSTLTGIHVKTHYESLETDVTGAR